MGIDHFAVLRSWSLNGNEAVGDFALIQTSQHLALKCTYLELEQLHLHNKSSEVCVKTRSPPASLPYKGQVTEQRTTKWSIDLDLAIGQSGIIYQIKLLTSPLRIMNISCPMSPLRTMYSFEWTWAGFTLVHNRRIKGRFVSSNSGIFWDKTQIRSK